MEENKVSHIENLHRGDKITVFSWKATSHIQEVMGPMGPMQVVQHSKSDGLVGDVLEILAVDPPFVSIKIRSGSHNGKRGNLDLRECKIMKVSKEYAESLERHDPKEPEQEENEHGIPLPAEIIQLLSGIDKPPKRTKKPRGEKG